MLKKLLASSAAVALVASAAAAGQVDATTNNAAWQLAQTQPEQPGAEPPAAGEPAAPADEPAAMDEPEADTAETPGDEPTDEMAEEPAADAEPGETAEAQGEPEQLDTAVFITDQAETHWLATDYIGQSIYNRQDEDIGSINDLIVEEDGGLVGFVVGVGGFLGIGQKRVAIDLDAVELQQDEEGQPKLVVAGSREALLEAPDFTDKASQQAEEERRQREMEAQQPPGGGGAPGGMGGAPGGAPGQ